MMLASSFLKLAKDDQATQDMRASEIVEAIKNGIAIGNPWLSMDITDHEIIIDGHEGRGRVKAIISYLGDIEIPIHIVPNYLRNRNITPPIVKRLAEKIISERGESLIGSKFFIKVLT